MAPSLEDCRLVFVAPAEGQTAVGDYSEDFIKPVRELFGEVVERRTPGPGVDGIREIRRHRAAVAELIAQGPPGRVLVHAELAAGGVSAFWAVAGVTGVPVSATIHDPPQGIWWPARTRFMAEHRLLFHAVHYPLRPLSRVLEGAVNGRRTLFALTETGRRSIEETYPRTRAVYVPHIVRDRPTIRPAQERRPKAVGFFGLVYRGKGFEHVARIRAHLPDDIVIRVAGRGTEALPRTEGIEILGGVDGPEEDAFFESIRAVVVPYGKRHWYAETYPASGVVAHAMAYRTPVISTAYGALAELDESQGAVTVPSSADADTVARHLADAVSSVVGDRDLLTRLGENADRTRQERSGPRTAEAFGQIWSQMLVGQREGV